MNSRPAAAGAAAHAITSRVHTPMAGTPSALAKTRAVTRPARSPVYGPGPVPTATASRSVRAAPPSASTFSIIAASSSPWRRELTTASAASTRDPSCRATVTAGVAVLKASSSTVDQRRSRGGLVWPHRSVKRGDRLVRGRERAGAHGGVRYRTEAVAVLLALHRDNNQRVVVPHYHGDLVGDVAAALMEDLQRGEGGCAQPHRRADLGLRGLGLLRRVLKVLQRSAVGVDGTERGAAVATGQQARRERLVGHREHPEVGLRIQRPGALALGGTAQGLGNPGDLAREILADRRGTDHATGVRDGVELAGLKRRYKPAVLGVRRGLALERNFSENPQHHRDPDHDHEASDDDLAAGLPCPGRRGPAAPPAAGPPPTSPFTGRPVFAGVLRPAPVAGRGPGPHRCGARRPCSAGPGVIGLGRARPTLPAAGAGRIDAQPRPGRRIIVGLVIEGVGVRPTGPLAATVPSLVVRLPRPAGRNPLSHGAPPERIRASR